MPFDLQPILTGTLVELRPLRANDFDALYAVGSDPLIWEQHPAHDRHERAVFEKFFEEALASGGALIAIDPSTHKIIGSSRFYGYDEAQSEIEIGWTFLARSYWGGKYNGEMKRLMLEHAFRFVDSVAFKIGVNNIRSQRAVEKIGATRMASERDASGQERYLYRITAAELAARGTSGTHLAHDSPETAALAGFPQEHCRVIASQLHDDEAYVLLDTGQPGQPYLYGAHCRRTNGQWIESGSSNGPSWQAVHSNPKLGTLSYWDEAPAGADAIRISFHDEVVDAPIQNGAFLAVWWQVPYPTQWPRVVAVRVIGTWRSPDQL